MRKQAENKLLVDVTSNKHYGRCSCGGPLTQHHLQNSCPNRPQAGGHLLTDEAAKMLKDAFRASVGKGVSRRKEVKPARKRKQKISKWGDM
jgi:hypothetical protein